MDGVWWIQNYFSFSILSHSCLKKFPKNLSKIFSLPFFPIRNCCPPLQSHTTQNGNPGGLPQLCGSRAACMGPAPSMRCHGICWVIFLGGMVHSGTQLQSIHRLSEMECNTVAVYSWQFIHMQFRWTLLYRYNDGNLEFFLALAFKTQAILQPKHQLLRESTKRFASVWRKKMSCEEQGLGWRSVSFGPPNFLHKLWKMERVLRRTEIY